MSYTKLLIEKLRIKAIQQLKEMNLLDTELMFDLFFEPIETAEQIQAQYDLEKTLGPAFAEPDDSVDGLIRFALTEDGKPIGLNHNDYGILISGTPGVGKTILLLILLSQAIDMGIKCWIFAKAEDLRPLFNFDENLLIISFKEGVHNFKINPLEPPPGMTTQECAVMIADILQSAGGFWAGTKGFLLNRLGELYKKFEGTGHYPNFFDLYRYIDKFTVGKKYRLGTYKDAITTRVGALLVGPLASVFDCSEGHAKHLIDKSIIFEDMSLLNNEQEDIFTTYLLNYLYKYKMLNTTDTTHWFVVDDSHRVFEASKEKRPEIGMPIIHNLATTIRKNRINILASLQNPEQAATSIHAISSVKIMFAHSDGKDIDRMAKSMGIKEPEQLEICHSLKKEDRNIIIKFNQRYTKPFFATIPEIDEFPTFDDDFIKENNERILSTFKTQERYDPKEHIKKEPKFKKGARRYLWAVYYHQYKKSITEMYKQAELGVGGEGKRVFDYCVKNNFVKIIEPSFGNSKYPILLPDGYAIIEQPEKKFYGKGAGYEHVLYQHLIAEHYKEHGYKAIIEMHRGGKHIDVGIETNEFLLGIEVEMSPVHVKENIEKDFRAGVDFLIVACVNEKVLNDVRKLKLTNKVSVNLISEVLKTNPNDVIEDLKKRR